MVWATQTSCACSLSDNLSDEDVQRLSDEKEALFRNMSGKLEPMPGALELVRHLHALAIPQAIGSSAPRDNIPYVLRALGIAELFDATVSRWDVQHGKPAPDIFLAAAKRLDMPPGRCIVLEDAPAGIAAAGAAGMRCIALAWHVARGHARECRLPGPYALRGPVGP